jgi:hypothetical protein
MTSNPSTIPSHHTYFHGQLHRHKVEQCHRQATSTYTNKSLTPPPEDLASAQLSEEGTEPSSETTADGSELGEQPVDVACRVLRSGVEKAVSEQVKGAQIDSQKAACLLYNIRQHCIVKQFPCSCVCLSAANCCANSTSWCWHIIQRLLVYSQVVAHLGTASNWCDPYTCAMLIDRIYKGPFLKENESTKGWIYIYKYVGRRFE